MTDNAHTQARDTRDARYDSLFLAEVVDNQDPEGFGRVKLLIPGLMTSKWAWPIGRMFGVKDGIHWVPEVGSNAVVFLNQGDVDFPYYAAGPFGAPQGESDIPEQAPGGSIDHMVIRWRDFHITIDGTDGAEKLTIQDLPTQTYFEIDRASGGDMTTDVEHDRVERVLNDRTSTVEQGDELINVLQGDRVKTVQVGDDVETIGGDKVKTVLGAETDLITGDQTETVLGTVGSTETVPAGNKTVTAGLNVSISAGVNVSIAAGAAISLVAGGAVTAQAAGASNFISAGLRTESFVGGILSTITGGLTRVVNGTFSLTVNGTANFVMNGIANFLGSILNLGLGPTPLVSPGYRRLVTKEFVDWFLTHKHGGVTTGGGETGVPTGTYQPSVNPTIPDPTIVAPNVDERIIFTHHVLGS